MAKTLRVLTRDGWVTKPAEDIPENRLSSSEVDQNFLSLEDQQAAHEGATDPHPQYTTAQQASDAAPVQSVHGRTGSVSSQTGDYTAAQVGADPEGSADAAETAAKNYTDVHAAAAETHGAPEGERIAHTGDFGTNAAGNRTVSTASPSGGSNGDIWYEVD